MIRTLQPTTMAGRKKKYIFASSLSNIWSSYRPIPKSAYHSNILWRVLHEMKIIGNCVNYLLILFYYNLFSHSHYFNALKLWGPVASGVLFTLNVLGLWPNDPVWGRRHIQRRLTKVEVKIALQEELKGIYNRPKPIRGEKSPRNICPRWFEASLSL